ncbi:hypothetical protein [Rathayibacter sp. VKM Ac-2760]|uniref:hypothetical protein n=1 Tax=Rathayibacter sp. VKM Ac-2760 TaxID=2609253 RepID=UPI001318D291|nr:hypothetical protein [Rathayibacter sp. VKM Ac-2760]QHC58976.1 hypothetical protein GSU72_10730 [Rathayibacter sp. VKM Ac-2760]
MRGDDGGVLNALVLSRERAERVLRLGLDRLGRHEHREHLVDVGIVRAGLVLLTEPPIVRTLEQVLDSGARLPPGAVVTVLAPVIAALREAAVDGVLLAPGADAVGLTEEGRPVLLLSGSAAARSVEEVGAAVRDLLGRCRDRCPEWRGSPDAQDDLEELEALLYRSAAPRPLGALLRMEGPPDRRSADPGGPAGRSAEVPARHRRSHPFDGWQARLRGVVRRRRGPLIAGAVILLGALLASGVGPQRGAEAGTPASERTEMRPSDAQPVPERSRTTPTVTPSPTATPTASASPTSTPTTSASPTSTPTTSASPTSTPTASASPASTPDVRPPGPDVGAEEAATALLGAVRHCGSAEVVCIAGLTTADSPIRSDAASVEALVAAAPAVAAVHADVNGASAIVAIGADPGTTKASVLMIRTEAGWLLRDVFTDGGR